MPELKNLFAAVDTILRDTFQDNPISEDDAYDAFITELVACEIRLSEIAENRIFQRFLDFSELVIL